MKRYKQLMGGKQVALKYSLQLKLLMAVYNLPFLSLL